MTGLFMLPAEVTVTVTREEQHQQALARYPVAEGVTRPLVAELAWCTIETGKYRGERAVEVRLDGMRVGELTYAMSERYQDLLTQVTARGHQPGCEALVFIGKRGIEVTLRLPRVETHVPIPMSRSVPHTPASTTHKKPRNKMRPAWIAAGAAGLLLSFISLINSPEQKPTSAPVVDVPPTTTTTVPTTTTSTTSSSVPAPPPPPPPAAPVAPTTKKSTSTKKPTPPPPPPPPAEEPPAQKCHPSYTPCVPIAKDVDCAGGSGNGPEYVQGPIKVIGRDEYGLDNNNDGTGCE